MKKPQRRVTTERVNTAFANYDAAAVEKFAAGAGAMLDGYHERTVAPLAGATEAAGRDLILQGEVLLRATVRMDRLEAWLRLPWWRRAFRRLPV
jgi:hypothetical protein